MRFLWIFKQPILAFRHRGVWQHSMTSKAITKKVVRIIFVSKFRLTRCSTPERYLENDCHKRNTFLMKIARSVDWHHSRFRITWNTPDSKRRKSISPFREKRKGTTLRPTDSQQNPILQYCFSRNKKEDLGLTEMLKDVSHLKSQVFATISDSIEIATHWFWTLPDRWTKWRALSWKWGFDWVQGSKKLFNTFRRRL